MATTIYALNLKTGKLTTIVLADTVTALHEDLQNDVLCAAIDTSVKTLFSSTARETGTWSRLVVTGGYETYSWLRVESEFTDADGSTAASVTVTVATPAGTVLSTSVLTSREPVRVAPFREREVVVTVTSKARVTEVLFASSAQELRA